MEDERLIQVVRWREYWIAVLAMYFVPAVVGFVESVDYPVLVYAFPAFGVLGFVATLRPKGYALRVADIAELPARTAIYGWAEAFRQYRPVYLLFAGGLALDHFWPGVGAGVGGGCFGGMLVYLRRGWWLVRLERDREWAVFYERRSQPRRPQPTRWFYRPTVPAIGTSTKRYVSGERCAICGRPVEGRAEAREVGGRWFCSPGHLLDFEGRARRRRYTARSLQMVVVVAAFAGLLIWRLHPFSSAHTQGMPAGFHARVDANSVSASYSAARVSTCFGNLGISTETTKFVARGALRGLQTEVATEAFLTSSTVDDVDLYFFATPALARRDVNLVARSDIYDDSNIPQPFRQLMNELGGAPPTRLAAIENLVAVYGNVAAVWQYPRQRRRASARLLRRCLSAARV